MPLSAKEMLRMLKKHGFVVISQNGSHVKLRNPETNVQIIMPMHSGDLKKGLEKSIIKTAGLKEMQDE